MIEFSQMRRSNVNRPMQEQQRLNNIQPENAQQLLIVGSNVFQHFYNVQKKLQNLKSKVTVLYGSTKSSITTLLCLIAGKQLIGGKIGSRIIYDVQGINDYKIGHGTEMETLQPNVYSDQTQSYLDFGAEAQYITTSNEMAEYITSKEVQDQLITSTSFQAALKKIRQIRFAMVIQKEDLQKMFFKHLIEQFIRKFAYDELNLQQRQLFLKSVLLIVTKAQQGITKDDYKQQIRNFRDSVQLTQFQKEFLNYFASSQDHMYIFEKAKIRSILKDNFPPKFETWSHYTYNNWSNNIIRTLNERIYKPLQRNRKFDHLNKFIQQRLRMLTGLLKKIIPFINKEKQKFLQKLGPNKDFSSQWNSLNQFFLTDQVYSDKTFQQNINYIVNNNYLQSIQQRSTHFLHLLEQLQKIYKECHKDIIDVKKFKEFMESILKIFSKAFCQTVQNQNLTLKIMFLTQRLFKEIFQLNQLNKDLINQKLNQELGKFKQQIKKFSPQSLKKIYLQFLKKIDQKSQLLYKENEIKEKKQRRDQRKLFDDPLLFFFCSFYSFLKIFLQKNKMKILQKEKEQFDCYFFIIKLLRRCIFFMYDDKSSRQKKNLLQNKEKSTLCLYLNISLLQAYQKVYLVDQKKKEQERSKQIPNQIRKYLLSLGECLTNLKQYDSASRLFYFIDACSRYDQVIEKQIQSQESSDKKISYLLQWGRFKEERSQVQDAIRKYQKAKDLETDNQKVLQEIHQKIMNAQKKKYKVVSSQKWYKRLLFFFFGKDNDQEQESRSRLSGSFIKNQYITQSDVYMYAFIHIALVQRNPISYNVFVKKTANLQKIQDVFPVNNM